MGLGFLGKYTTLFQWLGWAVLFALWPPGAKQLRRPGAFYLALLVNLLCTAPVLILEQSTPLDHRPTCGWKEAIWDQPWAFTLTNLWNGFSTFTRDFLAAEAGLQNPFYFLPVAWAACAFWRKQREDARPVFFFSMGAPLFLCYLLFTLHSRVLPNWIVPSITAFVLPGDRLLGAPLAGG